MAGHRSPSCSVPTATAAVSERPTTPAQLAMINELLRDKIETEVRQHTVPEGILQQVHAAFMCS